MKDFIFYIQLSNHVLNRNIYHNQQLDNVNHQKRVRKAFFFNQIKNDIKKLFLIIGKLFNILVKF